MLEIRELVISGDEACLQNALEKVEDEKCTERDWKWRGKEGRTVLELAAMLGRSMIVRLLLSAGAPPNVVSTSGEFHLHNCIYGHTCYTLPELANRYVRCTYAAHLMHTIPMFHIYIQLPRIWWAPLCLHMGTFVLCERTGEWRGRPSLSN